MAQAIALLVVESMCASLAVLAFFGLSLLLLTTGGAIVGASL